MIPAASSLIPSQTCAEPRGLACHRGPVEDLGRFMHVCHAADGPGLSAGPAERAIPALAARQHGVVARKQLVALGLGRGAIAHRLAVGRLHRVHPGVYAVGHPLLAARGRWMAAVLACGRSALLSHRTAASLWGLMPTAAARTDVTTPARSRGGPPGIRIHRVRSLHPEDGATVDGIPVTSVSRTLLDLAEVLSAGRLARALEEPNACGCWTWRRWTACEAVPAVVAA